MIHFIGLRKVTGCRGGRESGASGRERKRDQTLSLPREDAAARQGEAPHQEPNPLVLLSLQNHENKCLLFKPPSLWYSVTAAQAKITT